MSWRSSCCEDSRSKTYGTHFRWLSHIDSILIESRAKTKAGVIDEPHEIDAGSASVMSQSVLAFKEEQARLMPLVALTVKGKDAIPDRDEANDAGLCLPSELPTGLRTHYPMLTRLETSMRGTRLAKGLDKLRTLLQLSTYINKNKARQVRGQGASTRARSAQEAVRERVELAADIGTAEQYAELARVAPVMLEEWSQTKTAPRHADWLHEIARAEHAAKA